MHELEIIGIVRDRNFEEVFTVKLLEKIKSDIRSNDTKHETTKFLHDTFGEMIDDYKFVSSQIN